jgi:hypothetical protein
VVKINQNYPQNSLALRKLKIGSKIKAQKPPDGQKRDSKVAKLAVEQLEMRCFWIFRHLPSSQNDFRAHFQLSQNQMAQKTILVDVLSHFVPSA